MRWPHHPDITYDIYIYALSPSPQNQQLTQPSLIQHQPLPLCAASFSLRHQRNTFSTDIRTSSSHGETIKTSLHGPPPHRQGPSIACIHLGARCQPQRTASVPCRLPRSSLATPAVAPACSCILEGTAASRSDLDSPYMDTYAGMCSRELWLDD